MTIQAHNMFPDNVGFPISSQDYFFLENNNNMMMNNMNNSNFNDLKFLQLQQLQFQQQQQQQQQEYLFHLQNMNNKRNCYVVSQPSKKQKIVTTTATTASTTTSESDIHNQNPNRDQNYNNNSNINNNVSMGFSQSFSAELEKQSQEIDRFVTLQNERLRLALQEQRRQQMVSIIKKIEAKALQILQQKDEEIVEARKKSMEFQQMVERLELENQVWQKVALENESMVLSLNNTLEQLKQQQEQQQVEDQEDACSSSSSASSTNCVVNEKEETDPTRKTRLGNQETKKGVVDLCKICNSRKLGVVILPCKHLCCCSVCDAVAEKCPVCYSPKMASIQVSMS